MNRTFVFVWTENKKYSAPIKRHNSITVSNATGNIGTDAKRATDCFCAQFGNLKQLDIICIQELDEKGNPIGEPITPMDSTKVVPIKRK